MSDRDLELSKMVANDNSDTLLSCILATSSEAIVSIGVDQQIIVFNHGAELIFGYTSDEIIGKQIDILIPSNLRAEHADQIRAFGNGAAMSCPMSERSEIVGCRKNGEVFPAEASVTKAEIDGQAVFTVILRDITERRKSERLRGDFNQLRLITDNLPVLITYVDAQQRYRFVNKTCAEWLAQPAENIFEKTVSEIYGSMYEKFRSQIELVLNGKQLTFDETAIYPDGVTRTVHVTYVPHRDLNGSVEGYFSLVEDISELQQAKEELQQAQKMEAVGQLTGGVAHDFNNLLAIILGNTEILGDEIGDNQLLASIDRAATRGAELTQHLLAFSRRQTLAPQSIDLTELVSGLDNLLQRTLGEPIKILTHVPEDVWPVLADPGQLENALLNLSINARDAMPKGGTLEIRCSNIELQGGDLRVSDEVTAGDYVQITVRDTGSGLSEDALEHAFEPFYTTKDVGEGSGLGLSMVYGFALQSGGNTVIESKPGTGTEVKMFLPRAWENTASDDGPLRGKECKRGQGEAILVLEDDPDVCSFAVKALEGLGYRVHEAADAAAAMQVLEEEINNLDLLLSDVVLPGNVSGPELAAKAKDLYPGLKLVFMSGYAADLYTGDKVPGFDEALLTKPFRLTELAEVIHDTLAT